MAGMLVPRLVFVEFYGMGFVNVKTLWAVWLQLVGSSIERYAEIIVC